MIFEIRTQSKSVLFSLVKKNEQPKEKIIAGNGKKSPKKQ